MPRAVVISWAMKTAILCLALLCALLPAAAARADPMPFAPGEVLRYEVRWAAVPVAETTLSVDRQCPDGIDCWRFRMDIRTNSFADVFYKVRDRIVSVTDAGLTRTLTFDKKQKEGSYERDYTVRYDYAAGQSIYKSVKGTEYILPLADGTLDPLSIYYHFRASAPLSIGQVMTRQVNDGRNAALAEARVVGRETVSVPAGTFETFVVEPDMKNLGGVFKKSKDASMKIWVTADARCLPVKVRSKVAVGWFTAELTQLP